MLGKALLFSLLASTGVGHAPEEPLRLTLNLSSRRLEVWEGEERIRNYRVTIGQDMYPTPTGNYAISRIEWNPRWVPPPGRDWTRGKKERAPGKGNPMGRVKMQFDDYLYVHGTWSTGQLGGAHSHGCVRLSNQDALELARMIALRQGVVSEGEIAGLEKSSRRTRSVRLAYTVPLHIRHGVAAEREVEGTDTEIIEAAPAPEGSAPSGTERDSLVAPAPPGG
jgi:murein L,D-transpeptidase YcbB/YkuD